jgi:hypothetical protein
MNDSATSERRRDYPVTEQTMPVAMDCRKIDRSTTLDPYWMSAAFVATEHVQNRAKAGLQ